MRVNGSQASRLSGAPAGVRIEVPVALEWSTMKPKTLILRAAGTNCDGETAYAFELAGAEAERVHINRILQNPSLIDDYQILAVPGGFSYGDDIAAGRILANQIVNHLGD